MRYTYSQQNPRDHSSSVCPYSLSLVKHKPDNWLNQTIPPLLLAHQRAGNWPANSFEAGLEHNRHVFERKRLRRLALVSGAWCLVRYSSTHLPFVDSSAEHKKSCAFAWPRLKLRLLFSAQNLGAHRLTLRLCLLEVAVA